MFFEPKAWPFVLSALLLCLSALNLTFPRKMAGLNRRFSSKSTPDFFFSERLTIVIGALALIAGIVFFVGGWLGVFSFAVEIQE